MVARTAENRHLCGKEQNLDETCPARPSSVNNRMSQVGINSMARRNEIVS
jgi:hypothetical protein